MHTHLNRILLLSLFLYTPKNPGCRLRCQPGLTRYNSYSTSRFCRPFGWMVCREKRKSVTSVCLLTRTTCSTDLYLIV
ncbi:hypothetical protein Hanom_Chr17g01535251 [Helianthus anomalus]